MVWCYAGVLLPSLSVSEEGGAEVHLMVRPGALIGLIFDRVWLHVLVDAVPRGEVC